MSVIPFLLLSSAQSTTVRTVVYLDGSIRREVRADFLSERRTNVIPQLDRALPEADETRVGPAGEAMRGTWSVIVASAEQLAGTKLEYQDVATQPLSIFTYYTWTDTVEVPSETATAVEKSSPANATFAYEVHMPGWVTEAQAKPTTVTPAATKTATPAPPVSPAPTMPAPAPAAPTAPAPATAPTPAPASPAPAAPSTPALLPAPAPATTPTAPVAAPPTAPTPAAAPEAPAAAPTKGGPSLAADISGSTASFKLSAAHEAYEVTVTSRRVRWGYVLTLLYLLAFLAYTVASFLVRRAKLQPRRI
jgi:hypothetical protein